MDANTVDKWIILNKQYFPKDKTEIIKRKLLLIPENKFNLLKIINFKSPGAYIAISVLFGGWGIDRFALGDIGMGFLKLFTGGVLGVLTICDWFTTAKRVREDNLEKLIKAII